MELEDLLSKTVSVLSRGGQETLHNPPNFSCADQTHEPFRLFEKTARFHHEQQEFLWGVVSTSGGQFDGDRTDIHDVLSLIWGAVLRAFGLGSVWLIDEPHVIAPGEIGARHLIFSQCPWNISGDGFEKARKSMNAWSAFAFHLLDDVFKWKCGVCTTRPDLATTFQEEKAKWTEQVITYLRSPVDTTISKRMWPLWIYFASQNRGVTIVRMPKIRVSYLKIILAPFVPEKARGEKSFVIFANGIPNAIPYRLIKKARKLLSLSADTCDDPVMLPVDSHCLFIGDKTIVALRGDCGREIFEREKTIDDFAA